jgi:hypothetical protein
VASQQGLNHQTKIGIAVGISFACFVACVAALLIFLVRRQRQRREALGQPKGPPPGVTNPLFTKPELDGTSPIDWMEDNPKMLLSTAEYGKATHVSYTPSQVELVADQAQRAELEQQGPPRGDQTVTAELEVQGSPMIAHAARFHIDSYVPDDPRFRVEMAGLK